MNKLSVIIGRFQTNNLHQGHLELIREAKNLGDQVLVLIGVSDATGTDKNPLDFATREKMFYSCGILPNAIIMPVYDKPCDKDWSKQVDSIINRLGFDNATILGGRDNSVMDYYSGKHTIHIIKQCGVHSATAIREDIAKEPIQCSNFRAGIIYHTQNRYPIVYSTVDVVIYTINGITKDWRDSVATHVLMGKKGDKFCFIGGFVDPQDNDLYEAAIRECREETGFNCIKASDADVRDGQYVKDAIYYEYTTKVKDPRYKNTKDSIMTNVFYTENENADLPDPAKIQDKEFTEFKWIKAHERSLDLIADCHKPIFTKFINSKN